MDGDGQPNLHRLMIFSKKCQHVLFCRSWLSPLVVTLTGEQKKEKIL